MKKKFRCLVCGYVYEGENPPAECPQCHAKSDKFVEVKDEGKLVWACEHHLGDGKVDDAEVMQGLHDHFREVVWDTRTNLEKRAEAECGACEGKLAIASRAKQLGYDAIHDTVHEMAKDEARHGAGFQGLLKRYFGK